MSATNDPEPTTDDVSWPHVDAAGPDRLLTGIQLFLENQGLPIPGLGTDDQNGLQDASVWFDLPGASYHTRAKIQQALVEQGFEFFAGPRDNGDSTLSTYGIPVESLTELVPGDHILLNKTAKYLVHDLIDAEDGGPWKTKSGLLIVPATRTDTGTKRLFVQDLTTDDIRVYGQSKQQASGFRVAESEVTLHRYLRDSELE